MLVARRIRSADRRGSSWPVLVETDDGLRFTKLRGAGQGTSPLVAELIVGAIADALGLNVPARSIVVFEANVPSDDRDGELRALLDASVGENLGFDYLEGGKNLTVAELDRVSSDDAATIVWLDRFVMNPDRTARNPNMMWCRDRLWLVDHGAALGFQYEWSAVSEESPRRVAVSFERHVLADRVADLAAWDEIFVHRLTREVIEDAVSRVPDSFLAPLVSSPSEEAIRRRRAAYSAFLWKRLKAPRDWVAMDGFQERVRRGPPAWLAETLRHRRTDTG